MLPLPHKKRTRLICSSILLSLLQACSSGPVEQAPPNAITTPENLLQQGIQQYEDNDYASANKSFERALLQYRSFDQRMGIATSLLNLAKVNMAVNRNSAAKDYLDAASKIIEQDEIHSLNHHLVLLQSSLALKQNRLVEARKMLEPVLNTNQPALRLAALKNRTTIAFAENSTDKTQWLDRYRDTQKQEAGSDSHRARILRFEAEIASTPVEQKDLLEHSLELSRQRADRPAIAATLTQWGRIETEIDNHEGAEDKYLRALFIRHQLGDVKSCLSLLRALDQQYRATGDALQEKTTLWIQRLGDRELTLWPQLYNDFERYPVNTP